MPWIKTEDDPPPPGDEQKPAAEEKRNCGGCRFYHCQEVAPNLGRCRRRAPRLNDEGAGLAKFPRVLAIGWCGEWEARTEKESV